MAAFIANNLGMIAADQSIEATTALWISEGLVRQCGYDGLESRPFTNRAIHRFSERRNIAVTEQATREVSIANRNSSAARRVRKRAFVWIVRGHKFSLVLAH
ncbi:MAG TPA: hypothetical protein VNH18_24275 [Bryobacteraceae bacterium]|nr:hypothetical protein [Bryobacteraceae bacterium]